MVLRTLSAAIAAVCCLLWGASSPVLAQADEQLFLPLITHDHTPGWNWGDAYTVTVSAQTTEAPLAVIDRAGWPHLFWHDRTRDGDLHHVYLRADGWHELLPSQGLAGDSMVSNQPLVDQSGLVHLLWVRQVEEPSDMPFRFQHATFNGAQWTEPGEVFQYVYPTSRAWMRLDQSDRVRVGVTAGYLNWRGLLLMLQESWQTLADFRLPTNASIVWPDAVTGAHLFGSDATTLKYWRWLSDPVGVVQTLGTGRLLARSVAFDSADNMHIYWKAFVTVGGSSATLLHHQCVNEQRSLSAVSYYGGPSSVREVVSAAEQGRLFALAWQENARKRIMLWDGCTPGAIATIPETPQQTTTLRAVAVSSNPRKACVFLQQGATAVYTVRCADLD